MSFTNVMKYGLVSQGVACIPEDEYVPVLPTLAAGDYRNSYVGNWNNTGIWQTYNGSKWATTAQYLGQSAGHGYGEINNNVIYNVTLTNTFKGLIVKANITQTNIDRTLRISENLYMLTGILYLSQYPSRETILYIGGDMILTGGTMNETSSSYGEIRINGGSSKIQQYYNTGTAITNNIRWIVENNSIFKMDNYIIPSTCTGAFTLNAGCGLIIGSPSGITSSGAAGNIQTTGTRTFSTGADYTYNMSNGTQYTGNGLPTTVRNLSFTGCKKTMVLSNNITVTGTYIINPTVKVNLNGFTLTLP